MGAGLSPRYPIGSFSFSTAYGGGTLSFKLTRYSTSTVKNYTTFECYHYSRFFSKRIAVGKRVCWESQEGSSHTVPSSVDRVACGPVPRGAMTGATKRKRWAISSRRWAAGPRRFRFVRRCVRTLRLHGSTRDPTSPIRLSPCTGTPSSCPNRVASVPPGDENGGMKMRPSGRDGVPVVGKRVHVRQENPSRHM